MKIKDYDANVYDIEIFPNCFHCTVYDTESKEYHRFEISERINQIDELYSYFYVTNESRIFVGYNNHHYDDVIINYIIDFYLRMKNLTQKRINSSLFGLSQTIIDSEEGNIDSWKKWKYLHCFKSMDLLTMMFSSKLRVGLKPMQVTMMFPNVQEYDGDFNEPIPVDKIDEMIAYNINDVNSTNALLERKAADIELRLWIESEYHFECLSMDSVKFGETLLLNLYSQETGISTQRVKEMRSPADYIALKDTILPFIHFEDPILIGILEDIKKQIVSTKERKTYEKMFLYGGIQLSIGVGGIHSINKPNKYIPKQGEYIGHSDVNSLYPSMIAKHHLEPQHLGEPFWRKYVHILEERLEAKHTGQKLKNLALKLTLNSVTGKMQQETSWMYDPLNVFKIRINGQLILLMLIERLVKLGCKIIQANTDGVMYIANESIKEKVQGAISEIEQITQLTFDSDEYEAFYQFAVNDYFGVKKGYSKSQDPRLIEKKGIFITESPLGKGLAPTIIPKAVIEYFVNKVPLEKYITESTDITSFLMMQRVDKKFTVEYGDEKVQQINRFYASTNGRYLYKHDEATDKYVNILTKSGVTILNRFDGKPISERRINYQYYIAEARKIVDAFEIQQLELFPF